MSDSSSSGSMPALQPRTIDDDDSSSDDDEPPPLINRNNDNSSTSSSDGAPALGSRVNYESSSDEDSVSETFRNMFMRTNSNTASGPRAPNNNRNNSNRRQQPPPEPVDNRRQRQRERKRQADKRKKETRKLRASAASRIAFFFKTIVLKKRWKRLRSGTIRLQALWRGTLARKTHIGVIRTVEEFTRFYSIWANCLRLTPSLRLDVPDWAALRDQQAFIRQQELEDEGEERRATDEKLTSSVEDAMKVMEEKATNFDDDIEEVDGLPMVRPQKPSCDSKSVTSTPSPTMEPINIKKIHLSGDVVKWLKNGDPKYVDFFVRRMKQLSSGERSRILAKRLNGSTTAKVPIYETYLEQKSGFRILWTEKDDYLLVWYVAKHHRVSRLMRLIDDSKNRSERQRVSIHEIDEMKTDVSSSVDTVENHEIFLDPLGNVPLKVYDVGMDEIENITKQDWTPAMHLTEEERRVVEMEGTVLLLGRSGTGKTVCICNRMEFDRQQYAGDPLFSQLFIARSPRLCTYVQNNIGPSDGSEFVTFETLLQKLESTLPSVQGIRDYFPEDLFMKFSTFKREIYSGDKGVDALIVWTNIRSFLKGSIEALQNTSNNKDFFVSEEEFLSEKNFGKKRCRLATKQRKIVYEIFLTYKQKLADTNAWDNCDRIVALIQRMLAAKRSHPDIFVGLKSWCKWSKIYIDEVQDYTQAEILLFFHLSGAGNLFLAGDPAQNVTKGVEFRFDDIRSVGYHIAGGENRKLIPQKPKIVNVNFRSHAGILNAAGSILSQMFTYFPDSAKQLGRDDGLFKGPRPGIFHKVKPETMAELLTKRLSGTVVLTHDECVDRVMEKLGGYELVYGIRRAKGLEFKTVIIFDFFSSLPKDSQIPWRELLLNRNVPDFKNIYPEVEGHLKLLYTGITRCIDRLFFAETSGSISGDAFLRFMTNTKSVKKDYSNTNLNTSQSIATMNNIENIENLTMTKDEWLASGITNAEAAEAERNSDNKHALSLMEKAIYCFKQAGNEEFEAKASIQAKSFEFRQKLFEADQLGATGASLSWAEKEGAEQMENLLKENLLVEARGLGRDMRKMLQEKYKLSPYLERYVVQQLPGGGGYKD